MNLGKTHTPYSLEAGSFFEISDILVDLRCSLVFVELFLDAIFKTSRLEDVKKCVRSHPKNGINVNLPGLRFPSRV